MSARLSLSSDRAHADRAADPLVDEHAIYRAPGRADETRRKACRALFRLTLDSFFVVALRAATNGGWALGDAGFARQIADALGRLAAPSATGRPSKDRRDERQQLKLLRWRVMLR